MTEAAKAARRDYYREYYKTHKEKIKATYAAYWERKAMESNINAIKDAENAKKGSEAGC